MYSKDSPHTIQSMFDSIAQGYDRTNFVLSFSLHRRWNRHLINAVTSPIDNPVLVDLCAGTGDIAFGYLQQLKRDGGRGSAILVDFSSEMLDIARAKAAKGGLDQFHQIEFIKSDVQELPLGNALADCVTIAYGIRNVKEPLSCIKEAVRILKPGGRLGILELTRPRSPLLYWGHRLYMKLLSPLIGKMFADNRQAYEYLTNSIDHFSSPAELTEMMRGAGFVDVNDTPLWGGIATVMTGVKG